MPDPRPDHLTWRHRVLIAVVALAFVGLVGRLAQIQIVDHDRYAEEAAITRYGASSLPAPRGVILDATGFPLAISIDTWDVYLDSYLWRARERAREAADAVAERLGLDADALFVRGTAQDAGDVLLIRDLTYEQGLALDQQGLWGVRLLPSAVRVYPEGDLAGQLIGYVGLDRSGLWGVAADYEQVLRGSPGRIITERDLTRRVVAKDLDPKKTPIIDIMTANPDTLSPDDSAGDALELMQSRHFRHLPVVEDGKCVGMVSIRDLYTAVKSALEENIRETEAFVFGDRYGA